MEEGTITLSELQERIKTHLEKVGLYQCLAKDDDPNTIVAGELYRCGYHFYECGKYQQAVDFFTLLTHIDADNPANWVGLAASQQMQKKYNEALLAYSNAIILNESDPANYFHAATCCFSLEHIAEGLRALDLAESTAKEDPKYQGLLTQVALLKEIWSNKAAMPSDDKNIKEGL